MGFWVVDGGSVSFGGCGFFIFGTAGSGVAGGGAVDCGIEPEDLSSAAPGFRSAAGGVVPWV